jgi:hypothetical protein
MGAPNAWLSAAPLAGVESEPAVGRSRQSKLRAADDTGERFSAVEKGS